MGLYYRAIRKMPDEWIDDDTTTFRYGNGPKEVVCAIVKNKHYRFSDKTGWVEHTCSPYSEPEKKRLTF